MLLRLQTLPWYLAVALCVGISPLAGPFHVGPAQAGGGQTDEKQAFEAAKELGTVDGWDAFIRNYPSGFHADLARAYSKKLKDQGQPSSPPAAPAAAASPPAPTPSPPVTLMAAPSGPAIELSCSQAPRLKSERSSEAAKIRFINESGGTIVLQWIDFNGALKEYGEIQPGAELIQNTYVSHPWITAYQEGSCKQLFLAGSGTTIARVVAESTEQLQGTPSRSKSKQSNSSSGHETPEETCRKIGEDYNGISCVPRKRADKPSKKTVERRAKANCEEIGMIYLNGTCQPKKKSERAKAKKNKSKSCPAGMYRNPYGVCQPNETGG